MTHAADREDDPVADGDPLAIELSRAELREVVAHAVACALPAVDVYERERPDASPRHLIGGVMIKRQMS